MPESMRREPVAAPAESASANEPDYTRRSPMDLVCRQLPNADGGFDYLVSLPNPRHPYPPAPPICHHGTDNATTSMCWGYRGAGPADLALNVLAAYLPVSPETSLGGPAGAVRVWDGSFVAALAERLHPAFEAEVVSRIAAVGGVVTEDEIRAWLARQPGVSATPSV